MTYGLMGQRHDDYDADLIERIDDLYRGGFQIQKKAARHLCRLEGESDAKFKERCRTTAYISFLSQIIDQFTSDVFGQPLSVKPAADADNPNTPGDLPDEEFYNEFEKNVDRKGTSFVDLMKETLRTALKHRCALVMVDAPDTVGDPEPVSLAEEEGRGNRRLYAYECPIARLVDWKVDDETGRFVWAILYDKTQERATPFGRRDKVHETFTVWTLEPGATAVWARYGIQYRTTEIPTPETPLRLEASGTTSFSRIPILRFELPEGLWIGNKVGPQALEHWQRRSSLVGAENRSLVAIPYVKRGPQAPAVGGAIPADIADDQHRGDRPVARFNSRGYLELDAEDDVGFAEPEGKCYALVDAELEKLRETMFQVTFQMAASVQRNNSSMGRSGLSKKKDEDLTARVLRALGLSVRNFATEVFDCVSTARDEDVHWNPHGLDAYDSEDREALLEEAVSLDQVADAIPSETFHVAHATSVMQKLLKGSIDVQTISTIADEIKDGVHAKHEMAELRREAQRDALENPAPPAIPMPPKATATSPTVTSPPRPSPKTAVA